jgi:SAM-dependent methyltransferase
MGTTTGNPALTDRLRTTWAAGDYALVADRLVMDIGRRIVERTGVGPQDEVLDIATGTGNAAVPAAATGARVVGIDLVPDLLDVGRARAGEAGVAVEWIEGDAEDLPFRDESFDVVLSTLGVQFAPHHGQTARELARVLRPGGRIGLCNWSREGYIGRFFLALSPYLPAPPPGVSPPPLWGDEEHVAGLLAGTGVEPEFSREAVDFVHDSPAAFIDFMATYYGPLVKAREALTPQGRWDDLRADLVALSEASNEARDGSFRAPSEYLVVTGRRSG